MNKVKPSFFPINLSSKKSLDDFGLTEHIVEFYLLICFFAFGLVLGIEKFYRKIEFELGKLVVSISSKSVDYEQSAVAAC